MYAMLARGDADILMSGGRTQFVALKTKTPWLDINQEHHNGYAGYDGMIALVRQIDAELFNPIWEQVRTPPAPWERQWPECALTPSLSRKRARESARGGKRAEAYSPATAGSGRGRGPMRQHGKGEGR